MDASSSRRLGFPRPSSVAVLMMVVAAALGAACVAVVVAQEPARATFPGENGEIAFVGHDGKNSEEIFTVSPSGARPKQLTRGESHKKSPAWSADGRRVAFVKLRDPTLHGDIYTMRANGTDQAVVTSTLSDDSDPSWSPDGRRLVFSRNIGEYRPEIGVTGDREIFVVDRDGTDLVRLTRTPETIEGSPVWSPDGTEIAFSAFTPLDSGNILGAIYVMKADGSEPPEEVLSAEMRAFDGLSWSPDGQWLAYSGTCGAGECISKVRRDGTQPTFLTEGECGPRICMATGPEWSPDGEQITFHSAAGLYMMDAAGENMRSIGVSGSQPSWRPVVR